MNNTINYSPTQIIKLINLSSIYDDITRSSFQRDINTVKVGEIKYYLENQSYIDQETNQIHYPLLGVITLGKYNNQYYCIDGQHRLCAYKELIENTNNIKVLFQINTVSSYQDLRNLFRVINQNTQVPDYLLYEENENNMKKIKKVIRSVLNKHSCHFVQRTNSTRKVRRPNIRQHEMENNLFHNQEFLEMSYTNIINYIDEVNNKLSRLNDEQFYKLLDFYKEISYQDTQEKISSFITRAKSKNPNNVFLLGLFPEYTWLKDDFMQTLDSYLS